MSEMTYEKAKKQAVIKLDRIIEREGDENGLRREDWYLESLTEDILKSRLVPCSS